jgi:hypothetical protein
MAVTSVKERAEGRDGDRNKDGGALRRIFVVRTDNVLTAQSTILRDPRIPQLYSYYYNGGEVNLSYIASRIAPRQIPGSLYDWEVEVAYESSKNPDENNQANPTLRPADISWHSEQASSEMLKDAYGLVVQNSFGDIFDPPIDSSKTYQVLTIERNEADYDASDMSNYINTVCSHDFYGFDRLEAKMESISATRQVDPDFGTYWRVAYVIHFRLSEDWLPEFTYTRVIPLGMYSATKPPSPWAVTRRNVGWRYRRTAACDPDSDVTCVQTASSGGFQATQPVDLDTDRTKLNADEDPYYWIFRPYVEASWRALDLE